MFLACTIVSKFSLLSTWANQAATRFHEPSQLDNLLSTKHLTTPSIHSSFHQAWWNAPNRFCFSIFFSKQISPKGCGYSHLGLDRGIRPTQWLPLPAPTIHSNNLSRHRQGGYAKHPVARPRRCRSSSKRGPIRTRHTSELCNQRCGSRLGRVYTPPLQPNRHACQSQPASQPARTHAPRRRQYLSVPITCVVCGWRMLSCSSVIIITTATLKPQHQQRSMQKHQILIT